MRQALKLRVYVVKPADHVERAPADPRVSPGWGMDSRKARDLYKAADIFEAGVKTPGFRRICDAGLMIVLVIYGPQAWPATSMGAWRFKILSASHERWRAATSRKTGRLVLPDGIPATLEDGHVH